MDIKDKLNDCLKNLDANQLRMLANSNVGKEIASKLTEADKKKLLKDFERLDANKIKSKLSEINNGKLGKMSTDEIIRKLKEMK